MKVFKSVLIIVVVLAVAVGVLHVTSTLHPGRGTAAPADAPAGADAGASLPPTASAEQTCYIWNTEAGDKALLSMDVRGSSVIGEFHWLPAEKDKKEGIFKGSIAADPSTGERLVTALWDAHAEGTVATEELRIKIDGAVAAAGFGEMKDRGDGVYAYADPAAISYAPNLQQTDCGDSAMN